MNREVTHPDAIIEDVQRILEGDISLLIEAFIWADTPQGDKHWAAIWRGDRVLTSNDRVYLETLLKEA